MKSDRFAGLGLIIGCVGLIMTMVLHPVGGGHERLMRLAHVAIGAHALAIASMCCVAFGFMRLCRDALAHPLADAGWVAFALAAVCGSLAAAVSGILGPALAERAWGSSPDELAVWEVVFAYNFRLNAALTQVFIAGTAVAVALWSLAMIRLRAASSALGCVGIILAAVGLVALFTGNIRNSVHDVGLFIVSFALWTIVLGAQLCRRAG